MSFPSEIAAVMHADETGIHYGQVGKPLKDRNWILVLSDAALYKLDGHSKRCAWRRPLLDIHCVDVPETESSTLLVTHLTGKQTKFGRAARKMVGPGVRAEGVFNVRVFICPSPDEAEEWLSLFSTALQNAWQAALERDVIPSPEIYQMHLVMTKVNRKRKYQVRVLVISTSRIYNVKINTARSSLKSTKWSIGLPAISCVVSDPASPSFTIIVDMEMAASLGEKKRIKNSYTYVAKDVEEKDEFLEEFAVIFRKAAKRDLAITRPVEGAGPAELDDDDDDDDE